jgi:hypothetical protein
MLTLDAVKTHLLAYHASTVEMVKDYKLDIEVIGYPVPNNLPSGLKMPDPAYPFFCKRDTKLQVARTGPDVCNALAGRVRSAFRATCVLLWRPAATCVETVVQ